MPDGSYPSWQTIRSRYWQNRAHLEPDNFGPANRAIMGEGNAPKVRVIVRNRNTGLLEERLVSKELHHDQANRGVQGFDEPRHLREVWPWEHEGIDPSRRLDYDFIKFK